MSRKLPAAAGVVLLLAVPGLGWNHAGHMTMAAITYSELRQDAPATIARVVAILRRHPQYESRWKPQLAGMSAQDRERYLFMLAARWPDDVRGEHEFDRPEWHFIDDPYRPPGQPAWVRPRPPAGDNIIAAFQRNVAVVRSAAPDAQKAVALCWIFHLMGDSHQPLHTVTLFTAQFPNGDRGGTQFYIRANPSSARTQSLHAYWDDILLRNDHYDAARERAGAIASAYPRRSLGELAEPGHAASDFATWVRRESFDVAVSAAYRRGSLKGSSDRNRGTALPLDYHSGAQRVAERRVALAAYRLGDFLRTNFP